MKLALYANLFNKSILSCLYISIWNVIDEFSDGSRRWKTAQYALLYIQRNLSRHQIHIYTNSETASETVLNCNKQRDKKRKDENLKIFLRHQMECRTRLKVNCLQ